MQGPSTTTPEDCLAPTLAALGDRPRTAIDRLAGLGFRAVQLSASQPGLRPRELDRSGRRDPDKVWHNRIEDYQEHFSSFGLKWSVDWAGGMAICGLYNEPLA